MASLNDINARLQKVENNYYPKTGGILFVNNSEIGGFMAENDKWFIRGLGEKDQGYMEIGTHDNGNEAIKISQYSYDSDATLKHQIYLMDSNGNQLFNDVSAKKVYNAVWNDYAEFYERGECTEPGDIIGLNPNSDKEEYIKATNPSMCVGVHSDEYGHLIGGEKAPEGKDFVEYNMDKFIPVGLVGRVKTKIVGPISIGDKIVLSDIPGVGRKFIKGIDDSENIIGMAVENKTDESISRIRAHLRMGGGELILNFIGSNPHCEVIQ